MKEKQKQANEIAIKKIIKENDFDKIYKFIKEKMIYLFSTLDNYKYIYATSYENYLSFARYSPAFINMNAYSMISSFIAVFINLVSKDTVVGIHTFIKLVKQNNLDNSDLNSSCDELLTLLENSRPFCSKVFSARNKLYCHFDKQVLDEKFINENSKHLQINELRTLLMNIADLLANIKLSYKCDGVLDSMDASNGDDARYIKEVLNIYTENRKEIVQLRREKRAKFII